MNKLNSIKVIIFCLILCSLKVEAESLIRDYPYPFTSMLAFTSDVDMQRPEHGLTFHQFVNNELGLHISDSLWVRTDSASLSGLIGPNGLQNEWVSSATEEPTYYTLLKEWHKGNIDHFHGWQADSFPNYRYSFVDEYISGGVSVNLNWPGKEFHNDFLDNIVLITADELQSNSILVLTNSENRKEVLLPVDDAEIIKSSDSYSYTWSTWNDDGDRRQLFNVVPDKIKLIESSCKNDCAVKLLHFIVSSFSRANVRSDIGWLKRHKINTNYITSHGGMTLLQDYTNKKSLIKRNRQGRLKDPNYDQFVRINGNKEGNFAFHTDLLKDIGVRALWPYDSSLVDVSTNDVGHKILAQGIDDFYQIHRSTISGMNFWSDKQFSESLARRLKLMNVTQSKDLYELYCGKTCGVSQGDLIPLLIGMSLARHHKTKGGIEHFWYTHFSSGGDREFIRTQKQFFRADTLKYFKKLAVNYYSGLPMDLEEEKNIEKGKVWVISAASYVNYVLNRDYLKKNTEINGNVVDIKRWHDDMNKILVPDINSPATKLHGFTFKVDDPNKAQVYVDGLKIQYLLASNNANSKYITIVDDGTKSTLINNELISTDAVKIKALKGRLDQCILSSKKCSNFGLVPDKNGDVKYSIKYESSSSPKIINSHYVLIELDKSVKNNSFEELNFEINFTNGEKLYIGNKKASYDGAYIDYDKSFLKYNGYVIVPLHQMDWSGDHDCTKNDIDLCDMPNGQVSEVKIDAKLDPIDEATLNLDRISFLRVNPNLDMNNLNEILIMGKVDFNSEMNSNDYMVQLSIDDRKIISPINKFGIFKFENIEKNKIIKLSIIDSKKDGSIVSASEQRQDISFVNRIKKSYRLLFKEEGDLKLRNKEYANCNSPVLWVEKNTVDIGISCI